MNKNFAVLLIVAFIVLTASCGKDDDGAVALLEIDDYFEFTTNENQALFNIIGLIPFTVQPGYYCDFIDISSANTIQVSTNGYVTVYNENAFDYETNPTITTSFRVDVKKYYLFEPDLRTYYSTTITVIINLNDLDE